MKMIMATVSEIFDDKFEPVEPGLERRLLISPIVEQMEMDVVYRLVLRHDAALRLVEDVLAKLMPED